MTRHLLSLLITIAISGYQVFANPNTTCFHRSIDSTELAEFQLKSGMQSLEYEKVYKEAKKVFKTGSTVDTSALFELFKPWMFADKDALTDEVLLFNGSNGIIGKAIVLKLIGNKVESLSVQDWGR